MIIELTLREGRKQHFGIGHFVTMCDAPKDSDHATEIVMAGIVPMSDGRLMSPCYHVLETRSQIAELIQNQIHAMHGQ